MASLEGDNLVVFYYHSVSENWPDKRDGLSGGGQSSGILLSHSVSENWPDKRDGLSGGAQSSGILLSQCI